MKLSKRERILLIIVIFLALGAVYYFYYFSPFLTEMKGIESDISQKKARFEILNVQENGLKVLETQITDLRKQNADKLDNIPTGFSQPELLYFLQQVVGKNAQKASFNFEPPVDLVILDYTKATLTFFTDYAKLKNLLSELKESRFNNRILTLTINAVPEVTPHTESDIAGDTSETPIPGTEETAQSIVADSTMEVNEEDMETDEILVADSESEDSTGIVLAASSASAPGTDKSYGLQVILVVEFFNLKGEILKSRPEWNTFDQGKTDLFK